MQHVVVKYICELWYLQKEQFSYKLRNICINGCITDRQKNTETLVGFLNFLQWTHMCDHHCSPKDTAALTSNTTLVLPVGKGIIFQGSLWQSKSPKCFKEREVGSHWVQGGVISKGCGCGCVWGRCFVWLDGCLRLTCKFSRECRIEKLVCAINRRERCCPGWIYYWGWDGGRGWEGRGEEVRGSLDLLPVGTKTHPSYKIKG